MSLLARYLNQRIVTQTALVAFVFVSIFVTWALATFLSRAAAGLVKPDLVVRLVAMRAIIALDVILPISLYTGTILALGRLRRSGEAGGLQAVGFGPKEILGAAFPLFLVASLIVGVVSIWLRPVAYSETYLLRAKGERALDFTNLDAGRFYSDVEGRRVVFVGARDKDRMQNVFIWSERGKREHVIHVDELMRLAGDDSEATLSSRGLAIYRREKSRWMLDGQFGSLTTDLEFNKLEPLGYKRKAADTRDLLKSKDPEDIAELQWRLSRPLSTLLLAALALRLGGVFRPMRRPILASLFVISVGLGYELLSLTARNFVKDGIVGRWPGLWWVPAIVFVILLARGRERRRPRFGGTRVEVR